MTLSQVIPITRAASREQCKQASAAEEYLIWHMRWSFAVWRDFNRFWWGA